MKTLTQHTSAISQLRPNLTWPTQCMLLTEAHDLLGPLLHTAGSLISPRSLKVFTWFTLASPSLRTSLLVLQGAPAAVRILCTKTVPARLIHAALLHLYLRHLQTEQDAISCCIPPSCTAVQLYLCQTASGTPDSAGAARDMTLIHSLDALSNFLCCCNRTARAIWRPPHGNLATLLHWDLINVNFACYFVVRGGAVALQAGRLRVRFPMVSFEFFIDTFL